MTQTVFTLLHYPDAAVSALARPLARTLNLPQLPPHFPALVYSFLACTALHLVVSPALSPRLFPASYAKLRTKRQVNNWWAPICRSCLGGMLTAAQEHPGRVIAACVPRRPPRRALPRVRGAKPRQGVRLGRSGWHDRRGRVRVRVL